jgi:hypothetical protein
LSTASCRFASVGRARGSGTSGVAAGALSPSSEERQPDEASFSASWPLASRSLASSTDNAELSSGCNTTCVRRDSNAAGGTKRSSKERRSADVSRADEGVSESQIAAPNAQASTPATSKAVSDRPIRPRGRKVSAVAVRKAIISPIASARGHPTLSGLFNQPSYYESLNCGNIETRQGLEAGT